MANDQDDIPVAAPIDSDSAGRGGKIAAQAVVRVICSQINSMGTGFLHKSGKFITADHVVRGCQEATLVLANSEQVLATVTAFDADHDLALLEPKTPINATSLTISETQEFSIGAHVSTWGFPVGYSGLMPMLSVGYLSALDFRSTESGTTVRRWVVNAAFNSGNSGGPLLLIETGEVIGVVLSKLAPISTNAASALKALQNQASGFMYEATDANGNAMQVSEGQVVAAVLDELRKQVQLVIGHAVLFEDVRDFLKSNGVTS